MFSIYKRQRTYKPGSVRIWSFKTRMPLAIYLLPTSPMASIVLPSSSDGQPSLLFAGLHELSTPGTHSISVTADLVGSYPTFSPLPADAGGHSLLHLQALTNLFPLGSGMSFVARTFLSLHIAMPPAASRSSVLIEGKGMK